MRMLGLSGHHSLLLALMPALWVSILGIFASSDAYAGLIVSPATSDGLMPWPTVRLDGFPSLGMSGQLDQGRLANRSLGLGSFNYFGAPLSNLTIDVDGHLSANTASPPIFIPSFQNSANLGLRIAPLWADMIFFEPSQAQLTLINQIYETVAQGIYAVTWSNVILFDDAGQLPLPESSMTAQAVLFSEDKTIRGFNFQADDIAFGYLSRTGNTGDFGSLTAEIGLNSANNSYVLLPGQRGPDGLVTSNEAAAVIPWQPDAFVLFRPVLDPGGNFQSYSVSFESFVAVPEPTSILAMLSLLAAGCRHHYRRSSKRTEH